MRWILIWESRRLLEERQKCLSEKRCWIYTRYARRAISRRVDKSPVGEEGLPLLTILHPKTRRWLQKSVAFLALVATKNEKSACAAIGQ